MHEQLKAAPLDDSFDPGLSMASAIIWPARLSNQCHVAYKLAVWALAWVLALINENTGLAPKRFMNSAFNSYDRP
jgi:hypothetical protein